jgi:fatty acid desaturase
MARDRNRPPEAVRITTAASNRNDDLARRQRRYLMSMTLRSLCFVGAIVAALAGIGWLWPILIFGALILPYVAVVMANAVATRSDSFDLADTVYRRELEEPISRPLDEGRDRV